MKRLIVAGVIGLALSGADAAEKLELALLDDEGWWGGFIVMANQMPFAGKGPGKPGVLLNDNKGNQAVPLFVSSHGRWVWSEKPFTFNVKGGKLLITDARGTIHHGRAGKTLREAYLHASKTFFPPTGKIVEPLMMTRPQYNTWIELTYNQVQKDILAYARAIVDNGFPPGVLMIDDKWQSEYGDLVFDRKKIPAPKEMMRTLHGLGFKVMLWTTPFVHKTSRNYKMLAEKGFLVRDKKTGRPAAIRWWNGSSGALDLTNPGAVKWYKQQLTRLVEEYGADGFKFDAGDSRFYKKNVTAFKTGATGNDQSEAFARIGLDYTLNEYRACWKMGGQHLGQRLRDKKYSYEPIRELIPGMCMLGIMGHPFACPDMIGGGEYKSFMNVKASGNFDQELIVRSAQTHALMPMMQFSVAPWRILDKRHLAIVRKAAQLHTKFADTYLRLAREAARTGEPIIRYMEYEFPSQGFLKVKDQFMIGKDLLVAPVMDKDARKRTIRFPAGTWQGDDGSVVEGPRTVEVDAPLDRLSYYRRKQ